MPKKTEEPQIRKNVQFTIHQVKLIKLGVRLGMAMGQADYIRKAVDKLNEEIPIYEKIKKYLDDDEKLEEELVKFRKESKAG